MVRGDPMDFPNLVIKYSNQINSQLVLKIHGGDPYQNVKNGDLTISLNLTIQWRFDPGGNNSTKSHKRGGLSVDSSYKEMSKMGIL